MSSPFRRRRLIWFVVVVIASFGYGQLSHPQPWSGPVYALALFAAYFAGFNGGRHFALGWMAPEEER